MKHVAALLLLGCATLTWAGDPPVKAPAEAAAKPTSDGVAEKVRKRSTYTHAAFEMEVAKPIRAGDVFIEALRYPSPFESSDRERNDVVKARLFRTEKPEKAAVVALGGWRFDPFTPELAKELAKTGIQTLYVEIPFQGSRTPRGKRPGQITLSADLEQNEATFVQLAQDVGRAVEWLVRERQVDRKRIGILGTSLGGFVATTLYGMQDRFSCCTSLLSGADVGGVIFNGNYLTRAIREQLVRKELTAADVSKRLRGIDPLTWARKERKDGLFMVAAELDTIVPLASVKKLAKAYGGARVQVAKGANHIAIQALRAQVPLVKAHFEKRLLGREKATAKEPGPDAKPERGTK